LSLPPDASEVVTPQDGADAHPRPLMGATFWAMIALLLICVLAGVAVAVLVPRVLAPETPAKGAAETPI
jgi:hypothetical protein